MQEVNNVELKKYKNIERFVYDRHTKDAGVFSKSGTAGLILNAVFGTIFLIFDVFSVANKVIPISLIIINILMCIGYYRVLKKDSVINNSYKYNYFVPNLFIGLSGVYSSLVFLYVTNEILYWTFGSSTFAKSYMKLVLGVFLLIILIQLIWYSTALRKGYYSDTTTYESLAVKKKLDRIAKILVIPVSLVYVGISPFAYIFTRILVHTVESYPLKIVIFVTLLLVFPFGSALSFPVFIWWYMIRKYRKFIPEKVQTTQE